MTTGTTDEPKLISREILPLKVRQERIGKQTKVQQASNALTLLAHELGPDAKLPTVLQLRDRLGVSVTTVNAVLDELEARRIVRRRHGVGIYVARKIRQHRICLISSPSFLSVDGLSPFWRMLVDKVRLRAESEREALSFHFARDTEGFSDPQLVDDPDGAAGLLPDNLVEEIRQGRVDGILGIGLDSRTMHWIESQQVPYVTYAGPSRYACGSGAQAVVEQGTRCLAERGCERIGFWGAVAPYRFHERSRTIPELPVFKESLARVGQRFDPELVCDNSALIPATGGIHSLTHQEQGYREGMRVFGPESDPATWPDGILSMDDMLTVGLLTALQRLRVAVGEQVQIATHANRGSPALLGWEDRLIRLEIDPESIVNGMFDMLEELMQGAVLDPVLILFEPQLLLPEGGTAA